MTAIAASRSLLHEAMSPPLRQAGQIPCCPPAQESRRRVWPTPARFQNVRHPQPLAEDRLEDPLGHAERLVGSGATLRSRRSRCIRSARTTGYTRPVVHGATVPGYPSVVFMRVSVCSLVRRRGTVRTIRSDAGAAPAVSGPGGTDQHVAQFAQFGCPGTFVERGGNVLRSASHLVDPVRQIGRVVGGQHHRVSGQSRHAPAVQRSPLLIRPLAARLAAVPAPTAHRRVGHVPTAPAARLRLGATGHAWRL